MPYSFRSPAVLGLNLTCLRNASRIEPLHSMSLEFRGTTCFSHVKWLILGIHSLVKSHWRQWKVSSCNWASDQFLSSICDLESSISWNNTWLYRRHKLHTWQINTYLFCTAPQPHGFNTQLLEVIFVRSQWRNVLFSDQLMRFVSSIYEVSLNRFFQRSSQKPQERQVLSNCEY